MRVEVPQRRYGNVGVRARQGSEMVPTGCRETGAGLQACRTAYGGDGRGHWQGWKAPVEPRSVSPWLWQLSLPLRAMTRHDVLTARGHRCLLAAPWGSWKLLCHCCPSLGIGCPPSMVPRKSPEPCVRDSTDLPTGCRSRLGLSASSSKPRLCSAAELPAQRLCLPALTASKDGL